MQCLQLLNYWNSCGNWLSCMLHIYEIDHTQKSYQKKLHIKDGIWRNQTYLISESSDLQYGYLIKGNMPNEKYYQNPTNIIIWGTKMDQILSYTITNKRRNCISPEIFIFYKIYPIRHSILTILRMKGSGPDKLLKTHMRSKVSIISSHAPDCRIRRIKNILIKEIQMKH